MYFPFALTLAREELFKTLDLLKAKNTVQKRIFHCCTEDVLHFY
jgi:hypothetical protein